MFTNYTRSSHTEMKREFSIDCSSESGVILNDMNNSYFNLQSKVFYSKDTKIYKKNYCNEIIKPF